MWIFLITHWWLPTAIAFVAAIVMTIKTDASSIEVFLVGWIGVFLSAFLLGQNASYQISQDNARSEFNNVGKPLILTPVSVNYVSTDDDYDVAFVVNNQLYHLTINGPITIDKSLKSEEIKVIFQKNGDGDSRYEILDVRLPKASKS